MANKRNGTLYVGVTNDLIKRTYEHKNKIYPDSFTSKYNCDKLVYYEKYKYINDAIDREKQIKSGSRTKKITLIESLNPDWIDLSFQDMFWLNI
ncbi:GIY-YIG nuclease family protein [Lachnospiraceae bacterium OttesenSCG-928-E19]|nr:GIY-YIG nuclease family protein [Lachnospiraceae bacterium OttesenSCG-928-E19]